MRVVYVSTLLAGGPVSHLRTLVPNVLRCGAEVHVVCADERIAGMFAGTGATTSVAPMRHKLDLAGALRSWHQLEGDVVHTHDRRAGLFGRSLARLRGVNVVHTLHGLPEEIAVHVGRSAAPDPPGLSRARRAWLLHGYLRLEAVLAALGTVVTPSRAMADFLIRRGLPDSRVRVIPSGIDVLRYEPHQPRNPFVVGTITNLEYWKGVDVLIAAVGKVGVPLRLEVFGDGTCAEALRRQASSLGVQATFHGAVPDARDRITELDAFVLPSRAENLPIVILEAMASAVPVVATRVGGVPELVVDGESGLLVEPDDSSGMARAIELLAANPALRASLAREGARRAEEHFDPARLSRLMVELYHEICNATPQGGPNGAGQ